jgi:hypothetical protein
MAKRPMDSLHEGNVHAARPVAMMYRLHEGGDQGPHGFWSRAAPVGETALLSRSVTGMAQRHRRTPAEVDNKSTDTTVRGPEVLRITLLGGFRVSVGTRTIEEDAWHLRKAANLVKLLALAPGHLLHREQAMDALWPDLARRAASNNLRQVLHAARGVLDPVDGSRYLASENASLILGREGSLWVDAEAFEEAAIAARRARISSAYEVATEQYAAPDLH